MSDVGALAPEAPAPAPAPEVQATPPEPLKSHMDPKPADPVKTEKPSARDALKAAAAKVEAAEKAPAPLKDAPKAAPKVIEGTARVVEAKADPAKVEKPRGEHGHFAPDPNKTAAENEAAERAAKSEAKPAGDTDERAPPKRWVGDAKDAWKSIEGDEHAPVRKEIHRTIREMEAGITKYREPAQRFETVYRKYDDLARQSGVDPDKVLSEYVRLDNLINNPKTLVSGIEQILNGRGVTLKQLAEHVLGKGPDGQQKTVGKSEGEVRLERELAQLKARLDGNDHRSQQQHVQQTTQQVADWLASKEHGEALAFDIARHIQDGLSPNDAYDKALADAQELARTIGGGSGSEPPPSKSAAASAEELAEQTRKGSKSIAGAPSPGSAPATTKPASSIKEALKRAAARA